MRFRFLTFLTLAILIGGCSGSKNTASTSSSQRPSKPASKDGIKPFGEVIKSSAETDEGLFTIYKQEGDIFFEIDNELLDREILMVSRVAGVPPGFSGFNSAGSRCV